MKPEREAVAAFIQAQLDHTNATPTTEAKHGAWGYGVQELRALMDYLYGGPPQNPAQRIRHPNKYLRHKDKDASLQEGHPLPGHVLQ